MRLPTPDLDPAGPTPAPLPSVSRPSSWLVAGLAAALLPAGHTPAAAQERLPGPPAATGADSVQLLDRVAAVVADTAILVSEIQQEILRQQSQGLTIPRDPVARDSLVQATLDRMIDETLLLQRAKQQGIRVSEQDVDAAVQEQFNRIRSNFQSDQAFREAVESSGMNMFQFRQMWRREIRADLLRRQFQQQLLSSNALPAATVTDEEVRSYFERNQASARRPATLSFQRITVAPEPSRAARDRSGRRWTSSARGAVSRWSPDATRTIRAAASGAASWAGSAARTWSPPSRSWPGRRRRVAPSAPWRPASDSTSSRS